MARPTFAPLAPAPRAGAYAGLIAGLRGRFPGDPALHRDLLAAGTLDDVLAALARSAAAAAAVADSDPAAAPACAARAAALHEVLAFFGRTRGGGPDAGVRRACGGAVRVRAAGTDRLLNAAGWPSARRSDRRAGSRADPKTT
jgi:hypothetical protein